MNIQDWQEQLRGFAKPLAKVVLTVFLGMLMFELVQSLLWPDQSPWQSHAAEIIYAATLASVVGYFALRMHAVLYRQALEENEKYRKSETELRRTKEWFRSLTEHGSDLITVIDPKGTILYDSPSIERILGYRPLDRQGKSGLDLVHPEDIPGARSIIERAFQKLGSTHTIEMRVRGLDGRWHVLEATGKAMLDHDGKLRGIINSRDITERKQIEQKIAESREMLHRIVNHIPQYVFWKDRESNYLGCNQLFAESAGVGEPAAIVGKNDFDLAWKETAELYRADDRTVMETNTPRLDFEERQTRPDGSVLWLRTSKVPLQDRDGKVFGILGIYADITERKKMEEMLRESEETYRAISATAMDAIVMIDNDGKIIHWNSAAEKIFGYTAQEALGREAHPLLAPSRYRQAYTAGLTHFKETGQGPAIGRTLELTASRRDGTEFPIELTVGAVKLRGQWSAVAVARDITERKKAEEKLRLQTTALEASANGIVITDPNGAIIWTNQAFTTLTGYSAEEVVGRNPRLLKSGFQYPAFYANLWSTITSGRSWQGELVNKRKDGTFYTDEMTITPVRDQQGEITHFIAIKRDITERKQLERQARQMSRLAGLGQLIGGIAHEMKNPLFILTGRIQMAREKLAHQEYAALESDMKKIDEAGERMKTIAERFMTIARPVPPRQEQCSIQAILHKSMESLANDLTQNRIRVETAFAPDLPVIQSDPRQLYEVFLNLMQNAVQAMTHVPGERRLTVSAAREGTWVVARIEDTGPGIAPEHRAGLFEPFFTTKREEQGTGLGLWIARSTLMMLKGEITCESEVGKGTTFIVRLLANAEESKP